MSEWKEYVEAEGKTSNGLDYKLVELTDGHKHIKKAYVGNRKIGISKKTGKPYDFFDCSFTSTQADKYIAAVIEVQSKMSSTIHYNTQEKQGPNIVNKIGEIEAVRFEDDDIPF